MPREIHIHVPPRRRRVADAALQVAIKSNGQRTGTLSAEQFRKHAGVGGNSEFLSAIVEKFNAAKQRAGEPERAEIVSGGKTSDAAYNSYSDWTRAVEAKHKDVEIEGNKWSAKAYNNSNGALVGEWACEANGKVTKATVKTADAAGGFSIKKGAGQQRYEILKDSERIGTLFKTPQGWKGSAQGKQSMGATMEEALEGLRLNDGVGKASDADPRFGKWEVVPHPTEQDAFAIKMLGGHFHSNGSRVFEYNSRSEAEGVMRAMKSMGPKR